MKIYCEGVYTEDLSHLSKDELKEQDIWNTEPIKIHSISFGKNNKGQYCVNFKSENHKYLDIRYNCSRSTPDLIKGWERSIDVSTHEEFDDGDGIKLPVSRTRIWLQPETEEEDKLINGMICVLPEKWEYSCVIIPLDDFYMGNSEVEIDEFEEENDDGIMVYGTD